MKEPDIPSLPRILLVEDDRVSAAYMCDVAASLPARVDVAGSAAEALVFTGSAQHALLMIDAHLPDGCGESLLHAMRAEGIVAPALAHTAADDVALRDRLLAAGFAEVLRKPLAMADLTRALNRHLLRARSPPASPPDVRCWDDVAALAALGGQSRHVDALRRLFLDELPGQRQRISRAFSEKDITGMHDELHRLVASCGFVGATQLSQSVRQLQLTPLDPVALAVLQSAADALLTSAWTVGG